MLLLLLPLLGLALLLPSPSVSLTVTSPRAFSRHAWGRLLSVGWDTFLGQSGFAVRLVATREGDGREVAQELSPLVAGLGYADVVPDPLGFSDERGAPVREPSAGDHVFRVEVLAVAGVTVVARAGVSPVTFFHAHGAVGDGAFTTLTAPFEGPNEVGTPLGAVARIAWYPPGPQVPTIGVALASAAPGTGDVTAVAAAPCVPSAAAGVFVRLTSELPAATRLAASGAVRRHTPEAGSYAVVLVPGGLCDDPARRENATAAAEWALAAAVSPEAVASAPQRFFSPPRALAEQLRAGMRLSMDMEGSPAAAAGGGSPSGTGGDGTVWLSGGKGHVTWTMRERPTDSITCILTPATASEAITVLAKGDVGPNDEDCVLAVPETFAGPALVTLTFVGEVAERGISAALIVHVEEREVQLAAAPLGEDGGRTWTAGAVTTLAWTPRVGGGSAGVAFVLSLSAADLAREAGCGVPQTGPAAVNVTIVGEARDTGAYSLRVADTLAAMGPLLADCPAATFALCGECGGDAPAGLRGSIAARLELRAIAVAGSMGNDTYRVAAALDDLTLDCSCPAGAGETGAGPALDAAMARLGPRPATLPQGPDAADTGADANTDAAAALAGLYSGIDATIAAVTLAVGLSVTVLLGGGILVLRVARYRAAGRSQSPAARGGGGSGGARTRTFIPPGIVSKFGGSGSPAWRALPAVALLLTALLVTVTALEVWRLVTARRNPASIVNEIETPIVQLPGVLVCLPAGFTLGRDEVTAIVACSSNAGVNETAVSQRVFGGRPCMAESHRERSPASMTDCTFFNFDPSETDPPADASVDPSTDAYSFFDARIAAELSADVSVQLALVVQTPVSRHEADIAETMQFFLFNQTQMHAAIAAGGGAGAVPREAVLDAAQALPVAPSPSISESLAAPPLIQMKRARIDARGARGEETTTYEYVATLSNARLTHLDLYTPSGAAYRGGIIMAYTSPAAPFPFSIVTSRPATGVSALFAAVGSAAGVATTLFDAVFARDPPSSDRFILALLVSSAAAAEGSGASRHRRRYFADGRTRAVFGAAVLASAAGLAFLGVSLHRQAAALHASPVTVSYYDIAAPTVERSPAVLVRMGSTFISGGLGGPDVPVSILSTACEGAECVVEDDCRTRDVEIPGRSSCLQISNIAGPSAEIFVRFNVTEARETAISGFVAAHGAQGLSPFARGFEVVGIVGAEVDDASGKRRGSSAHDTVGVALTEASGAIEVAYEPAIIEYLNGTGTRLITDMSLSVAPPSAVDLHELGAVRIRLRQAQARTLVRKEYGHTRTELAFAWLGTLSLIVSTVPVIFPSTVRKVFALNDGQE